MEKIFYSPLFALIVGLGFSMVVPLVGELSGSFILMVLTLPLWIKHLSFKDKIIKKTFYIFISLLLIQIATEIFNDYNLFIGKIRGIALTVTGMTSFFFAYAYFRNHMTLFKWYMIGIALSPFIFTNEFFNSLDTTYSEEDVTYFKFYIAPLISNCVLILTLFSKKLIYIRQIAILNIFLGLMMIVLGARSSGLTTLIPSIIYLYTSRKRISLSKVKKSLIACGIAFYLAYTMVYVPMILSGTIKAGNNTQLLRSHNPYSPIEMLKMGRTDSLTPFFAFLDRPLTGWGYLAKDPNFKYTTMNFELAERDPQKIEYVITHAHGYIPGHSIIFYFACSYGIGGLICMFLLWYQPTKILFRSLTRNDRYKMARLMLWVLYSWHWFFSPCGHLKYIPGFFAIIIATSIMTVQDKKRMVSI